MSFETEMRERVKRGESLDSIMPSGLSFIVNKLETEKKITQNKLYKLARERRYRERDIAEARTS